jgi:outer membrane lipoprotein-sorting protein
MKINEKRRNKMKSTRIAALMMSILPFFVWLWPFANALADDPRAREIMEKVDARDDGDNRTADMEMILIDKRGNQRVRKIATFSKDKDTDELRLMFFQHPADVKDTSFLTHDYDDPAKDDDQWLYLPALRKTKRIASSDKSGSFMGSDLNYSDMTDRNLEDYDFTFKKEMDVKGVKTWLIESTPRSKKVIKETGYKKSLIFVRQDNYVVIRAVNWVKDGGYLKYVDVKRLELIDGIWVATETHVTKKKGKKTAHKTVLKFDNVKFNQKLDYEMFTIRRMEKGL